jgi:hypothetical protein
MKPDVEDGLIVELLNDQGKKIIKGAIIFVKTNIP